MPALAEYVSLQLISSSSTMSVSVILNAQIARPMYKEMDLLAAKSAYRLTAKLGR